MNKTFEMTYTIDIFNKEVRIYEFRQIAYSIDWKTALGQDCRKGEENIYIPQVGDPHKFIKTINLIHRGINTSAGLGIAFGSSAKKEKDLARRGEYLGRPVIELGLACRIKVKNQSSSIYALTEKGKLIAESDDQETCERLLAEALLGFYPVQLILQKTTRDYQELTKDLIQEVITLVSLGDCGGTTNPRRASSLRALVNWVSRLAGIPILRQGSDAIQLYIPQIYAK